MRPVVMRRLFIALLAGIALLTAIQKLRPKPIPAALPSVEHVREYVTRNGTVVHAHDRAKPRGACSTCQRDESGRIARSTEAKREFERTQPCPGTGRSSGGCPGYVIDHVKPLACGGADSPFNMQWQTVAAAKAKDKVERAGCR